MKKSLLLLGAAAAMLASCSQEETPAVTTPDQAIGFSAYTATSVTRGDVVTVEEFTNAGIGVFAFYQPATNGVPGAKFNTVKYPTPNFMYNENIEYSTTDETWSYSPVKYWPNNKGDQLSFFAYAPYDEKTTWEDLGINTDATGTTLSGTLYINNDVKDQKDYLFADPVVNQTKPTSISSSVIGTSTAVDIDKASSTTAADIIRFDFKHVTSKINLFVGVEVDNTGSVVPTSTSNLSLWKDDNTVIEIKSIEFKDLYQALNWTKTVSPTPSATVWAGDKDLLQDIKVIPSDKDNANLISSTNSWGTESSARWHRVLSCDNVNKPDGTTNNDQYMFLAPQELKDQEIVITYVVKTTHVTGQSKDNDSEITNVITKTWADFLNDKFTKFEAGKQYNLHFLIGMQSVKVAATVTDWVDGTSHVLDVPTPQGN